MAGIRLVNLIKRFGKVEAVKNVNLEVRDGEFTVLVGPSGCGKSTTLRMIAGLEDISEGEIYIGERLVNDLAAKGQGYCHGVSGVCALSPYDGLRQHGL